MGQGIGRRMILTAGLAALAACGSKRDRATRRETTPASVGPADVNALIAYYARQYDVPEALVHRVVRRESNYNPQARNGPYYGLMQILPQTARTMGHRGEPGELLDASTNLRYGVKYLRGAWMLSRGNYDTAVSWCAKGYYYEAKRRGMLVETGLKAA